MMLYVITPLLMVAAPFIVIALTRQEEITRDTARSVLFSGNRLNVLCYTVLPLLLLGLAVKTPGEMTPLLLFQMQLLIIFGAAAAIKDYREHIIPNRLILVMAGIWAVTMLAELVVNTSSALLHLTLSFLGALLGGGMFLIVYALSKKGLGGGDVKLMAVFGLYLTIYRIAAVMLYGTLMAAVTGIVLIALKKIGRKDGIPLAPFLYAGLILALAIW